MKRKFILLLALSAAILSACNGNTVQESSSAEGEASESYTTGSYQQHFSESLSLAERGAEASEEESDNETGTTAPEETETEYTETTSVPLDALYRFVDVSFSQIPVPLGNDIICSPRSNETDTPLVWQYDLDFININENRIVNTVSLPEGFEVDKIYSGSGNVIARILSDTYDHRVKAIVTTVAVVYDDYTFDIIDEPAAADFYFDHYGHKISEWGVDLVCVDGESEVIVPGYEKEDDEWGFETKYQIYEFPIDEDRFVYRTGGYEWLPGFGIYDFSTKTARDVPDSKDLIPIGGVHDGKVYSVKTAWDGLGTELYVTDIETLETSFFMDFPYERQINDAVRYYMPESGRYILSLFEPADPEKNAIIYIIDPDTGKVIKTYDNVPQDFNFYGISFFIDDDRIAFSGNKKKILIFSPQNLENLL